MPPTTPDEPFFAGAQARRLAWLCAAALVLAALVLNLRALGFGFLYLRDDDINVALNPHMGGLGAARLAWMFTDSDYVRRYIPLGWLGFSATYQWAGLDAAAYHGVGLGLYALNCALVLALVLHALRLFPGAAPQGLGSWAVASAALGAAWWAFNPLRVETTAWVSGNLYGQACAFALSSVIAYLRTFASRGRRRLAWLLASAALFAASLLTYPIALGVPALLIGLDWLRARKNPSVAFRRLLLEKALFLAPLAAVLLLTVAARYAAERVYGAVPGIRELPLSSRLAQSAYVAAYYVWKPWWPTHLSPLYDSLVDFRPTEPRFLASLAAVGAACALALAWVRTRPAFAVVWLGYLAAAAPFFGLTEKPHMTSDRYGCLLCVFTAAVAAAAVARLRRAPARAAALALSAAVLALAARMTWRQLDVWTNDRVQHAYVAAGLRNSELLDDFRSRQLILEFMRGDEESSARAVDLGLRRNPASPGLRKASAIIADKRRISAYYGPVPFLAILHEQRGLDFARQGDLREANDHFEEALRMDDRFYQAAFDRALVLLGLGRCDDALRSYLLADRRAPAGLPQRESHEFLVRLRRGAEAAGLTALAHAASAALAR